MLTKKLCKRREKGSGSNQLNLLHGGGVIYINSFLIARKSMDRVTNFTLAPMLQSYKSIDHKSSH